MTNIQAKKTPETLSLSLFNRICTVQWPHLPVVICPTSPVDDKKIIFFPLHIWQILWKILIFQHENLKKKTLKMSSEYSVNEVSHVNTYSIPCKYHVTPVKRQKRNKFGSHSWFTHFWCNFKQFCYKLVRQIFNPKTSRLIKNTFYNSGYQTCQSCIIMGAWQPDSHTILAPFPL